MEAVPGGRRRAADVERFPAEHMGYDLHITRKEDWSDEDGPVITEAEWRRVIHEDPELQLDTDSRCTMADGEYIFASWNGEQEVLAFYGGEITSKYPTNR